MSIKINNMILSHDDSLETVQEFYSVKKLIKNLQEGGLLQRMSGNCIGSCEIIGNMLYQKGIKSYMIETQLTLTNSDGDTSLIGYDNFLSPDKDNLSEIDTHTVLIILLEDTQLLLDPSIGYLLPQTHLIILEKVNGTTPDIIAEYFFKDLQLVYTSKAIAKIPYLTQQNLLSTILNENKNSKKIEKFSILIYGTIGLTLLNMIINILILSFK
jgi:hypothetical protein